MKIAEQISEVCKEIETLLIEKNRKYGNSALAPIQMFSRVDPRQQLCVRIDDKLNRKINRQDDEDEDIDLDLIGYLILLRVYDRFNS